MARFAQNVDDLVGGGYRLEEIREFCFEELIVYSKQAAARNIRNRMTLLGIIHGKHPQRFFDKLRSALTRIKGVGGGMKYKTLMKMFGDLPMVPRRAIGNKTRDSRGSAEGSDRRLPSEDGSGGRTP
jgi:hypothetical protein